MQKAGATERMSGQGQGGIFNVDSALGVSLNQCLEHCNNYKHIHTFQRDSDIIHSIAKELQRRGRRCIIVAFITVDRCDGVRSPNLHNKTESVVWAVMHMSQCEINKS